MNRLEQYALLNQSFEKVELIIMGGTFVSYPKVYQELFVPGLMKIEAMARSGKRYSAWLRTFNAANELFRQGRHLEALKLYRPLAEQFPEKAPTHDAMGDVYMRLQNPVQFLLRDF